MENICDYGITKFIEMVDLDSRWHNPPTNLSLLLSVSYKKVAELRGLASAVQ
jgi:hypothetical protein